MAKKSRKATKKSKEDFEHPDFAALMKQEDLDYFANFVRSFNPEVLHESLNFSFVFNLIMINFCLVLRDHPEPRKFVTGIFKCWEKSMKRGFEPQIKKHMDMLQTPVGSCIEHKVYDSDAMRVMLHNIIKQTISRYKVPLMNMVEDIENDRNAK